MGREGSLEEGSSSIRNLEEEGSREDGFGPMVREGGLREGGLKKWAFWERGWWSEPRLIGTGIRKTVVRRQKIRGIEVGGQNCPRSYLIDESWICRGVREEHGGAIAQGSMIEARLVW